MTPQISGSWPQNAYNLAILLVTFLGWWKRDPFKGLSDLQLGDQKVTAWITWKEFSADMSMVMVFPVTASPALEWGVLQTRRLFVWLKQGFSLSEDGMVPDHVFLLGLGWKCEVETQSWRFEGLETSQPDA